MTTIHEQIRAIGGTCTDGPLPGDFEGWAVHPFSSAGDMVAHWFTPRKATALQRVELPNLIALVFSRCGNARGVVGGAVALLAPGNVRRCRRCEKLVQLRRAA